VTENMKGAREERPDTPDTPDTSEAPDPSDGLPPEVRDRIDESIRAVEAMRIAGLDLATALQEAKAGTLRREVARRRSKYGEGSPQEAAAIARLEAHEQLGSELALDAMLARRPPSRPEKGAFVLEGHVVDEAFGPVPGAVASAVLENGDHVVDGETDKRGRFRLVVPVEERTAEPKGAVRLEVALEEDGEVVARDDFPVTPTNGNVVYRRVVVAVPPEDSSRRPSSSGA
jgi:hypothetical protein